MSSRLDPRLPVIVGTGQLTVRTDRGDGGDGALEPVASDDATKLRQTRLLVHDGRGRHRFDVAERAFYAAGWFA